MRTRYSSLCLLLLLSLISFGLKAQSRAQALTDSMNNRLTKSTRIISIDGNKLSEAEADSVYRRIGQFYYDQFRNAQDPAAPSFMFLSKDASMMMGIGGVLRMRCWYDFDGSVDSPGFVPSMIPVPMNQAQRNNFGSTPSGTDIYLFAAGHTKFTGEYQVFIEANFNGYQHRGFKLKKAYATIKDFTIGLAPSTFSDPAALPNTVDAGNATNKLGQTPVLVRYMPTFRNRWSVGVSIETPDSNIGADGTNTKKGGNYMPDFAALLQYQWGHGQHVRLSGVVRGLPYRDLITGKNKRKTGWGLQLSSVAHPIMPAWTTYLTFNIGQGYSSLCNDFIAVSADLIADPDRPGVLYAPTAFGYCAAIQYNFRHNLFATAMFSQNRYLPQHEVPSDQYRYGWSAAVNVFWNITTRFQVAAEMGIARRNNFSGQHAMAHRIGMLAQFSF